MEDRLTPETLEKALDHLLQADYRPLPFIIHPDEIPLLERAQEMFIASVKKDEAKRAFERRQKGR